MSDERDSFASRLSSGGPVRPPLSSPRF